MASFIGPLLAAALTSVALPLYIANHHLPTRDGDLPNILPRLPRQRLDSHRKINFPWLLEVIGGPLPAIPIIRNYTDRQDAFHYAVRGIPSDQAPSWWKVWESCGDGGWDVAISDWVVKHFGGTLNMLELGQLRSTLKSNLCMKELALAYNWNFGHFVSPLEKKGTSANTWEVVWGVLRLQAEGNIIESHELKELMMLVLTIAYPRLRRYGVFHEADFEPVNYWDRPTSSLTNAPAVFVDQINIEYSVAGPSTGPGTAASSSAHNANVAADNTIPMDPAAMTAATTDPILPNPAPPVPVIETSDIDINAEDELDYHGAMIIPFISDSDQEMEVEDMLQLEVEAEPEDIEME